ncbi:hypothetical protein GCM10009608_46220 [Pseudonocardia alaniniphila]
MENLLSAMDTIRERGLILAPAGGGRVGFVAVSDVAAVAARALTEGDPPDIQVITGPEALDYADVAARVSAVFARQVDYADIPAEEARSMMLDDGVLLTCDGRKDVRSGRLRQIGHEVDGHSEDARAEAVGEQGVTEGDPADVAGRRTVVSVSDGHHADATAPAQLPRERLRRNPCGEGEQHPGCSATGSRTTSGWSGSRCASTVGPRSSRRGRLLRPARRGVGLPGAPAWCTGSIGRAEWPDATAAGA